MKTYRETLDALRFTPKLHSYGAMGVRELTTTKFVALGTGQIRE